MHIKSRKDFYSGLLYLVVGSAFAWGATRYTLGTGARMGPGYFPLMLGVLLALIGVVIMVRAAMAGAPDGDPVGRWAWRQIVFILGANFLFGVLLAGLPSVGIPPMGMVAAIYGLTFVASLGGERFRFREVFILATALAAGSYAAFVWALKLQFPVWPSFIAG